MVAIIPWLILAIMAIVASVVDIMDVDIIAATAPAVPTEESDTMFALFGFLLSGRKSSLVCARLDIKNRHGGPRGGVAFRVPHRGQ